MTTSQFCIIATIVVYLVAMVLVGVYCSRKGGGSSSHEFYLGGRKLGPIVTAMSAEASDMSSYLLMGLPGQSGLVAPTIGRMYVSTSDCRNSDDPAWAAAPTRMHTPTSATRHLSG